MENAELENEKMRKLADEFLKWIESQDATSQHLFTVILHSFVIMCKTTGMKKEKLINSIEIMWDFIGM